MNRPAHDSSLNFLIYAFYAIFLWGIYYGFSQSYINIFDDIILEKPGESVFLKLDYGEAATLVLLATVGFFTIRYFSLKLSKKGDISLDAGSRLGMLRLILLAASISAIIDAYILISALMTGLGAARELFKTVITFAIATGIIVFCLFELRCKSKINNSFFTIYSTFFLFLSIIIFSHALYMAPPWEMRKVREDIDKLKVMHDITDLINAYFKKYNTVPDQLTDLEQFMGESQINELLAGKTLEYRPLNVDHYEICAIFQTNRFQAKRIRRPYYREFEKFNYTKGRSCFKLKTYQ